MISGRLSQLVKYHSVSIVMITTSSLTLTWSIGHPFFGKNESLSSRAFLIYSSSLANPIRPSVYQSWLPGIKSGFPLKLDTVLSWASKSFLAAKYATVESFGSGNPAG